MTIGTKNTWDDWGLIPSSRPKFAPPQQKTSTVDIQGGDGVIDMSESLTGFPVYNNREGSFEFYVVMDCPQNQSKKWIDIYEEISGYLHGKNFTIVLDDDPDWYYEGRLSVNDWDSANDGTGSTITINYSVKPYKLYKDPVVQTYTFEDSSGAINITSLLDRMPVTPDSILTSGEDVSLEFTDSDGSHTYVELKSGSRKYYEITFCKLYRDVQIWLTASGSASVTITFRNGRL
jgi:predicted phage tail component-like protein